MELVPRLIEAFTGKEVIGAAGGHSHTAVWTDAELFTFGDGATGWATFDLVLRAVARAAMVRWPANFVLCSHF